MTQEVPLKAIGFDLFNTLITVDPETLEEATVALVQSLRESGFRVELEVFREHYRKAAWAFFREAQKTGRETHNRFWISVALGELGYGVGPEELVVARAVEAYFSPFFKHLHLIPGTLEMLGRLKGRYRLGLASNFTHAPVAERILHETGLSPYLDAWVISGEIGYRKPHPRIFETLVDRLGVRPEETLFVGDEPGQDITGAMGAGLRPVWISYVQDHGLRVAPSLRFGPSEPQEPGVPHISTWDDLSALLQSLG